MLAAVPHRMRVPSPTIRSVVDNLMLYHEGWGVGKIKHSLTYSGGLSRSYARTYAPARSLCFRGFSPFALPSVIAVSEAIPFIELTGWSNEKLYALKLKNSEKSLIIENNLSYECKEMVNTILI